MEDYELWLRSDRLHREIRYQLSSSFQKLSSRFSFVRVEGLTALLRFCGSLTSAEHDLFRESQQEDGLNVHEATQTHILNRSDLSKPHKITTAEMVLVTQILQILLPLDDDGRNAFLEQDGMKYLLRGIRSGPESLQIAALDALLAIGSCSDQCDKALAKGAKHACKMLVEKSNTTKLRGTCAAFAVGCQSCCGAKEEVNRVLGEAAVRTLEKSSKNVESWESVVRAFDAPETADDPKSGRNAKDGTKEKSAYMDGGRSTPSKTATSKVRPPRKSGTAIERVPRDNEESRQIERHRSESDQWIYKNDGHHKRRDSSKKRSETFAAPPPNRTESPGPHRKSLLGKLSSKSSSRSEKGTSTSSESISRETNDSFTWGGNSQGGKDDETGKRGEKTRRRKGGKEKEK